MPALTKPDRAPYRLRSAGHRLPIAAMDASLFEFHAPPELARGGRSRYPVVIVGAGPVGLAAAIDLGLRGIRTLLIDEDSKLSEGSRAICFAKRTLEILDRLGCGDRAVDKGVVWNVG